MSAPAEPALQVQALSKSFGDHRVLDAIDLQIESGEVLALLGRSGTGKSVLLKLIVGLQQADSGSIRVQGAQVRDATPRQLAEIRTHIGFLFQSAALYDAMTVEENVAFPLRRHRQMSGGKLRDQVRQLLASVGMEGERTSMPAQISGGMRKRVGLARALALSPDVLLFDEPTAGLDPLSAREIGELILAVQQQRNVAAVVVTHDVPLAQMIADRLMLMRDGRIVAAGTFSELQRSSDRFVADFLQVSP